MKGIKVVTKSGVGGGGGHSRIRSTGREDERPWERGWILRFLVTRPWVQTLGCLRFVPSTTTPFLCFVPSMTRFNQYFYLQFYSAKSLHRQFELKDPDALGHIRHIHEP